MLQVDQYFETNVPNIWVVEANEPSHWEVPWPKDVDEIEYFVPML
jgi:hypothetical protein